MSVRAQSALLPTETSARADRIAANAAAAVAVRVPTSLLAVSRFT